MQQKKYHHILLRGQMCYVRVDYKHSTFEKKYIKYSLMNFYFCILIPNGWVRDHFHNEISGIQKIWHTTFSIWTKLRLWPHKYCMKIYKGNNVVDGIVFIVTWQHSCLVMCKIVWQPFIWSFDDSKSNMNNDGSVFSETGSRLVNAVLIFSWSVHRSQRYKQ